MVLEARRMVDQKSSGASADNCAVSSSNNDRLDTVTIQALNAMGYEEAAQHVYGMTYNDYKKRHQKKATDEQMQRYQASAHLHAQHDKALLDTRASSSSFTSATATTSRTSTTAAGKKTTPPAITPSSVCCENVEQVAAVEAASSLHGKTTRTIPPYQPAPIPTRLLFINSSKNMEPQQQRPPLRIGVLTVSDRAYKKEYATGDLSGPAVRREIQTLWNQAAQQQQSSSSASSPLPVFETSIVPDEIDAIQQQIKAWCGGDSSISSNSMDLVFTTGGTGFSRRDVTPEATRPLLYQECTSLMSFCATECSKLQPLASLSRGTAGIILQHDHQGQEQQQQQQQLSTATNTTMIANLPGNPQAIAEIMPLLLPLLLHALCDLRGII
jgi:molybdopterin adenylyltransferase